MTVEQHVQIIRRQLDEIERCPDPVARCNGLDEVGAVLAGMLEESYAEASALRALANA